MEDGNRMSVQDPGRASPTKSFLERNRKMKEAVKIIFGEFFGTLIFISVALGGVAQFVLGTNSYLGLCLAFAFGAAIGIFNAANLSGGHLNPAVTVALCITDRCKWKNIPFYWIGQFIGAFAAAALVYGTYSDGILHLDPELSVPYTSDNATNPTAGIFATYPAGEHISNGICFLDQIVGTFILVISILAVTDSKNEIAGGIIPIFVGMSIAVVGLAFGHNCGFSLNPARDFGPRLFTACVYGSGVFSAHDFYFWIPMIGPWVGGALAGVIYRFGVETLARTEEL